MPLPLPSPPAVASPPDPRSQASRLRRLLPWAAGLSVATVIALSARHNAKGGDVLGSLASFDSRYLPALVGLHLLMQLAWALRFRLLAGGLGFPMPLRTAQLAVTSGLFAAAVTPGRVGGEPWRIALLIRRGASGATASRIILADRAVDMLFFLGLGLTVVLALPRLFGASGLEVRVAAAVALSGLLLIALLIAAAVARPRPMARALAAMTRAWDRAWRKDPRDPSPAIASFFEEVRTGLVGLLRTGKRRLAAAVVLSLVVWTCEFGVLWLALRGFGHDVPFIAAYATGVLVTMVGSLPLLPGGAGAVEVVALAVLTPIAPGLTPAFLVVWRGTTFYMDLALGGVAAAWALRRRKEAPTERGPAPGFPGDSAHRNPDGSDASEDVARI